MRLIAVIGYALGLIGCGSEPGMCDLKAGTYIAHWRELSGTCGQFATDGGSIELQGMQLPWIGAGGACEGESWWVDECSIEYSADCAVPQDDGGELILHIEGDTLFIDRGQAVSRVRINEDNTAVDGTCSSLHEVTWVRR